MTYPKDVSLITTLDAMQLVNGEPRDSTLLKILPGLEQHSKNFLQRAPFLVLATSKEGSCDASPRGDEPGFVKVLDDTTLLIPERPGNRIADSMSNILVNPAIGLIFMVPGMNETLRINGNAYVTDQPDMLEKLAHKGKPPKLAIILDIKQVYFHCAKAFIRSKLWQADEHMPRGDFPTLGKILLDQIQGKGVTDKAVDEVDANLSLDSKENLYHQ